jgi:hypothetical protein
MKLSSSTGDFSNYLDRIDKKAAEFADIKYVLSHAPCLHDNVAFCQVEKHFITQGFKSISKQRKNLFCPPFTK